MTLNTLCVNKIFFLNWMKAAVNLAPSCSTKSQCPGPDSVWMAESSIVCDEIRCLGLVAYAVF